MKGLLVLLFALLAGAHGAGQDKQPLLIDAGAQKVVVAPIPDPEFPVTKVFSGRPPVRFMGTTLVPRVTFGHISWCGKPEDPDHYFVACVRGSVIFLPHPCEFPTEEFAQLTCHELAHINGWPGDHGP